MKINIGGGCKRFDGYANVDIDSLSAPDIIANLETDTLPIKDNVVTDVMAHHILEHVGLGFGHMMQELYRICRDGAIIDIRVPHHRSEIYYGDYTHIRPVSVEMMRQFSKKHIAYHMEQWGSNSGHAVTLNVDFEIIEFNFKPQGQWTERFKTMSQEEIVEVSTNFNNVYEETQMKLVVVKEVLDES